jgi:hypothetical protein
VPVASGAGAWPWIIRPAFGVLVETGEIEPLIATLGALIADSGQLATMATEARRAAVRDCSIQREVDQIHALYARLTC